ncbi:ABC transporter ATP-binding protein [Alsobacter sp. SYSU M60028]|uniref:ABC transporter ATP-binding protein n=1 Tax=Alsobacter ponti TaxID=2962936 RepID=A0ABT1L6W4_9HYPH|nr:ABC transporter ATP-binding protein [Alsobacter ponti]MCP8937155.1 ABC transporter ATP-binding protein [Alsobacter ponti]
MIRLEGVTRFYGERAVVDDVSLVVEKGEMAVVVGRSGSGKSTLLRMINRLVEPTSGLISIDGRDVSTVPAHVLRRGIGYVIQGHGLFPHRTVADNIATVPRLLGWPRDRIARRVSELLELLQLSPARFSGQYPHQLSGGEQQRVGVARALAAGPDIVLMDEPFGALDPIIRSKAQDDLKAIQARLGATIVLVTHDMDEAFRLGDRIAVMEAGRVLQYGTPRDMIARPADPRVAELTGSGEGALRLLALVRAGDAAEPFDASTPPPSHSVPAGASLREALASLLWTGEGELAVTGDDGRPVGRVTLASVLRHGRSP